MGSTEWRASPSHPAPNLPLERISRNAQHHSVPHPRSPGPCLPSHLPRFNRFPWIPDYGSGPRRSRRGRLGVSRYGFYGMPNIIYLLIPAAVILTCVLIYLASTNFRGFLLFGVDSRRVRSRRLGVQPLTPSAGFSLVIWFILRGLRSSTGGGSSVQSLRGSFRRP